MGLFFREYPSKRQLCSDNIEYDSFSFHVGNTHFRIQMYCVPSITIFHLLLATLSESEAEFASRLYTRLTLPYSHKNILHHQLDQLHNLQTPLVLSFPYIDHINNMT